MTREEELTKIENAITNGKLKKITSEESMESFFNKMRVAKEEASIRIKRVNRTGGLGTRTKSKFKEII